MSKTYTPMTMGEREERLKWIFNEADRASEQEWDSEENFHEFMEDLLNEAAEHQKYLTGTAGMLEAMRDIEQAQIEEERALQAKQDDVGSWSDSGEWLNAVWRANNKSLHEPPDPRLLWWDSDAGALAMKDMSEAVGADGGFLVPPEFRSELLALEPEPNMFVGGTTRVPMNTRELSFPSLDQTDTTAGRPHWFGGIQVYRLKEAGEKIITDAQFREVTLVAHEIIAYARVSNALLADSIISLASFFNSQFGFNGAIQHRIDWECFNGNGAGEFLGVIPSPATITVARQTAGTITYPDLLNMLQRFYSIGGNGMWFCTQGAMSTLAQIAGPAGNPSYIWHMDAKDGLPGRLLGMPIAFTEKLPALGVTGDIVLANRPFYLYGDRQAITIDSSVDERFRNNQTAFRAVARNDGKPWLSDPFTLQNGTDQVSPFVILGGTGS